MTQAAALTVFRDQFPAAQRSPYFATNGYGLLPIAARDAVIEAAGRLADRGYAAHARLERGIGAVREQVADFIGASPDVVAFVRNTADGMGFIAESIDFAADDEVVVFDGDYGTVVYPYLARAARGEVRVSVAPLARDGVVTPDAVAAVIGPRTRVVALSWVRFDSGARCDLAAIADLCHARGVLFVVDAIQGLGVFPLDVRACGIDALAAGSHKWQCGLAGSGVLFVARDVLARLRPTRAGLDAFDLPHDGPITGYPFSLRTSAARVEDGAQPEVAIAALGASLAVLGRLGLDAVRAQVQTVTSHLCAGVAALGGRVRSPREAEMWSGILALEPPPGLDATQVSAELVRAGVMLGARDGALWIGAHAYTTVDDADRVLAALRSDGSAV